MSEHAQAATPGDAGLSWRVFGRFADYVVGSGGRIDASGGALIDPTGTPSWPLVAEDLAPSGAGCVRFGGMVRFQAHFGALDVAVSEPEITIDGETASLRVHGVDYGDDGLLLARSTWRAAAAPPGIRLFIAGRVELAAEASALFGGVYAAGQALDPFVVALREAPPE